MSVSVVKAMVPVGEIPQASVYLTALQDGDSYIALSVGESLKLISPDEARELAEHLVNAADQLGDGTLTISVTRSRR